MNKLYYVSLFCLIACSRARENSLQEWGPEADPLTPPVTRLNQEYLAELVVLNESVAGPVSGNVNFKLEGDQFSAYIRLFNSLPGLVHEQRFYKAPACPTEEQDLNGDGYVDIQEAHAFLGLPIFPLDADLTSEEAGYNTFLFGDAGGSYWYEQIISYELLLQDLHREDARLDDDFVKLPVAEDLKFDEGVLLVMGVSAWSALPETVASSGGYANFQTLPVACGSLRPLHLKPGRIQEDRADPLPNGPAGGPNGEYDDAPYLNPTGPNQQTLQN